MKIDDIAEQLAQTQALEVTPERAGELWTVAARLNRVTLSAAMKMGTLGDPACFSKALVDSANDRDPQGGGNDPDRETTD